MSIKGGPIGTVSTGIAAELLGLTPDRISQLVRAGHATSPQRGYVNLASLLRGYVALLRAGADKPASVALAKHQMATAEIIEEGIDQQRAGLIDRTDAELAVVLVSDTAAAVIARRLKAGAAPLKRLPREAAQALAKEGVAAIECINSAREVALAAIRTGNLAEVSEA